MRPPARLYLVEQRRECDLAFSDHHVIDYAGAQAFFGISGGMCASEYYLNARMRRFQPFGFLDRGWKLTGHTADAGNANAVFANEAIDVVGRDSVDDHVEDVHFPSGLAQPSCQVDVVQRHILYVPVERRGRSDEGKHLTAIVADLTAGWLVVSNRTISGLLLPFIWRYDLTIRVAGNRLAATMSLPVEPITCIVCSRRTAVWIFLTVLALGIASQSFAQVAGSASLSGTIRDEAGAQVPGAAIVLTEVARHLDRNSVSNDAGRFAFPNIPAGAYTLTVTKAGFEMYRLTDIRLEVDQQGAVEVALRVGAVTTTVDVSAKQEVLLETESNTIGTVVDSERIVELPLNGRNPLQLALLAAGANDSNNRDYGNNQTGRADRAVVIGGNLAANTSYLLNGIVVRGSRSTELTVPLSPDAVDQFRVQQSFFMPDQGPGPAIVNFATKGGTDTFHGTVYEFLRNEDLDARNYFSLPVPDGLHRNQFGFTLGGPVKKNRIWFFGLYEGYRQATAFTARAYTPTSSMFSGNFQAIPQTIYDPASFNSQTGTRSPFAGNTIPSNRINPVSEKLLQYYLPGASLAELPSNLFLQPRNTDNGDQYGFRIDASLTSKQTLFAQIIKLTSDLVNAGDFPASGSFYPANTGLAMLQHTWTLTPTLVSTARFGIVRNSLLYANQGSTLGSILPGIGIVNTDDTRGVSGVSITGYTAFGHAAGDLGNVDNVYQLDYGLNSIRGQHNLVFGANLRYYRTWQHNSNASALGALAFQSLFTAQLQANSSGQLVPLANSGNAFADFLLGTPATATLAGLPSIPYRATEFLPYVADTWKVTRGLTLNYGISWFKATVPNPVGRYHEWAHGFDFSTGLLTYAALGQINPEIVHPHNLDFTPRLGFAWQPWFLHNTVVRGGAGIYYADYQLGWTQWGMVAPPYSNSASLSNVGLPVPQYVLGQNVFPASPALSSAVTPGYAATLKNAAPFLLDPNSRISYMQQWNLTVQHTFRQNDLLEVIYMGSSDHDLLSRYDADECIPALPNLQCVASTRPYPQYGSLLESLMSGNSSYEALAARFDHRMSSGLNARFEYTFAKALTDSTEANNPQIGTCRACEKGPASFNAANRAVLSLIYDVPFGRGRQFGARTSRLIDAAAGGWTVSAIASFQSGIPVAITAPNLTGAAYGQERPNRICNGNDSAFSGNLRGDGLKQFNTACFASPASGYFGNSGWNVLNGPGVNNWDIGIQKYFTLSERTRLQWRAEMFNAFNHAQFGLPDGNVADPGFGLVASAGSPRLIQFGLKLLY